MNPDPVDGAALVAIARAAIEERLGGSAPAVRDEPWLRELAATFVTLRREGELRGCIGSIDPRRAFATDERFPGIDMRGDWPAEAMAELKPDRRTAVVALTHDPKLDDPALQAALRSPAFYIGALGSRKTHAARLERLAAAGFTSEQTARVHGPVGLSIGALSPAEIAISVLAQITAIRRGG